MCQPDAEVARFWECIDMGLDDVMEITWALIPVPLNVGVRGATPWR